MCIVEQTQKKKFNMFMDVDLKYSGDISTDFLHSLLILLHRKIKGGIMFAATCFRNDKYGIHVVWPNNKINAGEARSHVTRVVEDLNATPMFHSFDWSKIMDSRPYGTGLRMIFNHKFDRSDRTYGDPYIPYASVDLTGIKEISCGLDHKELFKNFTIHDTESKLLPYVSGKVTLEAENILEKFLRMVHREDPSIRVTKLIKRKNSYSIITNSKFCPNVGRNHRGNHVWFKVTGGFMYPQCTDDTCIGFRSSKVLVPPHAMNFIKSNSISGA